MSKGSNTSLSRVIHMRLLCQRTCRIQMCSPFCEDNFCILFQFGDMAVPALCVSMLLLTIHLYISHEKSAPS